MTITFEAIIHIHNSYLVFIITKPCLSSTVSTNRIHYSVRLDMFSFNKFALALFLSFSFINFKFNYNLFCFLRKLNEDGKRANFE